MRIDKFLKLVRIITRRELAKEAVENGKVLVSGKPVKPSFHVKANDELTIQFTRRTVVFRVVEIPDKKNIKREDAPHFYEVLQEIIHEEAIP